jgi:hypothetical protein
MRGKHGHFPRHRVRRRKLYDRRVTQIKSPPALPFQNKRERLMTGESIPHDRTEWKP